MAAEISITVHDNCLHCCGFNSQWRIRPTDKPDQRAELTPPDVDYKPLGFSTLTPSLLLMGEAGCSTG